MSGVAICDASALVATLVDSGPAGGWSAEQLSGRALVAPDLMPYETANILRRHERSGLISPDLAAQAHADLLDLRVELWPHEVIAHRAWELRHNLSIYDAGYVALAERLAAPLITLDARIAGVPQLRCSVLTPPSPPDS